MPRLVVIATGGTISTQRASDGSLRPACSGEQLAGGLGVEIVDLLSVDSSELTPRNWLQIGAAVNTAVADGADGVVIAHGTDTLEETSLWLDLTYAGTTPVILTGAARASDAADADGPANLRDALTVAGSARSRDLGVLICFAGAVLAPLGTTKTAGPQTFAGGTRVGTVAGGVFGQTGPRERPYLGDVSTLANPPRVDIVPAYPGADSAAVDAYIAAGARGLVIEAVGHGNAGTAVVEAVRQATARGIAVAITTRIAGLRARAVYGPGYDLIEAGAVMVPNLRTSQARVLLMAALATGLSVSDVVGRWG
ncbi:MAG: asparaginase [Mycobacterium sp.]